MKYFYPLVAFAVATSIMIGIGIGTTISVVYPAVIKAVCK